jgi:hypothetical protein
MSSPFDIKSGCEQTRVSRVGSLTAALAKQGSDWVSDLFRLSTTGQTKPNHQTVPMRPLRTTVLAVCLL